MGKQETTLLEQAAQSAQATELASAVQEYGQVFEVVESLRGDLEQATKRLKELQEVFRKEAEHLPADEALKLKSTEFAVTVTQRALRREVKNKTALVKLLGPEAFMKLAQFRLKDLDVYLNEAEQAQVVETSRDGDRRVLCKRTAAADAE